MAKMRGAICRVVLLGLAEHLSLLPGRKGGLASSVVVRVRTRKRSVIEGVTRKTRYPILQHSVNRVL